jgi:hypothetical protein
MVMLLQTFEERAVGFDRAIPFSHFFAHRDRDVPRPVSVVTDAAKLLAHQTIRAGVDDFFQLGRDGIQAVKHALRHEPARLRGKSLEAIELVGGTFALRPGHILHWIGRTMTVTRAAQNTARAALVEPFRIEPFFDSFKAQRFVAIVFHEIHRR